MDRIEELKRLISQAREDYYNLDPKVPDTTYDIWIEELKTLVPGALEVTSIGAHPPVNSPFAKVKHEIPMGSLNKVNSYEELLSWSQRFQDRDLWISHKMDGLSMELIYEDSQFKKAITRGDGITGEDVTHNVAHIVDIPKLINMDKAIIRGEVILKKSIFKSHFAGEYANPRNTAAAKVREKDGKDCKYLNFRPYFIHSSRDYDSFGGMFNALSDLGFYIPDLATKISMDSINSIIELESNNRDKIDYDIDGLVISTNSIKEYEALGSINLRPEGQIAYKFESEKGISNAVDIRWQTGSTGRVVPVLIIDPISIGGVTISRVSLQNHMAFRNLKLFKGCRVLISRRNDCIPYCEANLSIEDQDN